MDIIFYLNEDNIELIRLAQRGKENAPMMIDWQDQETIEATIRSISEKSRVGVVLDFIDESIEHIWLPKLMPWEKGGLEARQVKKMQAEGAIFVNTHWEKEFRKTTEGRSEQSLRVMALAGSDELKSFFKLLEKHFIALVNIYSISDVVAHFYRSNIQKLFKYKKNQLTQPCLFLIRESTHVFRQVILRQNDILLTRLIELDDDLETEESIGFTVVEESHLAIKYLYNQKILPYNSEVNLFYLDHSTEMAESITSNFNNQVVLQSWNKETIFIDSATFEQVSSEGMIAQKTNTFFLTIASYLFHKKPEGVYQTPFSQKMRQFLSIRKILLFLLGIGLILSIIILGQLALENLVLADKNQALNQKIQVFQSEKKRLSDKLKIKYNAEDMREIVIFSDKVLKLKEARHLGFDITALTHILQKHQHIQLMDISWHHSGAFDESQLSIEIKGWVYPFKETYAMPVKWVDDFLADLKPLKGVQSATLTQEPLDRNLSRALTIQKTHEKINALPFSITLQVNYVQ